MKDGDLAALQLALGAELKEIRRELKLSQSDVASGVSRQRSYLSELERGKHNPTLETLNKMSVFYGVSLATIFAGVEGRMRLSASENFVNLPQSSADH